VSDTKQAKRFLVSGMVQGVGFRYFTQDVADRLRLAGYVRNLRGASVHNVAEESVPMDSQYSNEFTISYDA
jgi:acylphosphatase